MSSEYTNNHYVPQWYQHGFIPADSIRKELFYLDLAPSVHTTPTGHTYTEKALRRQGPSKCFAEDDLYTRWLGDQRSTTVESQFFGEIDDKGRKALEYFVNYDHTAIDYESFQNMMPYMGAQKLRTPKGLEWLAKATSSENHDFLLYAMIRYRNLFSALWTECVWQIADASDSQTKFIVSDHPITVYNQAYGTHNRTWKQENEDPSITLNGSHTIFPLTLNKVLILTNLSWARNPYQSSTRPRPNANPMRGAIFNYTEIQVDRKLNEEEVRQINFVIKKRAHKYIGAGQEDWLHPERYVNPREWNNFGDGILFMPDPRSLNLGGQIIMGFSDGSSLIRDEYGRQPGDPGFTMDQPPNMKDHALLDRFKGEFAHRFGPQRRGRKADFGTVDPQEESPPMHEYHLRLYRPRGSEAKRLKNRGNLIDNS